MKTKSLMTAGALAMFMAACSNEELVTNNEQLSMERPLAGEVVVTPIFGGEADSRALWGGTGWDFQAGDKFAAYLMDTWNGQGVGFENYNLVDYIHTNYPFLAEGTAPDLVWKSVAGAPLCEGNYFFAWPFNETYANRGQVGFSVSDVQYAVQKADGEDEERFFVLGATKENQKYLGYSFVESANGDVNNVDISFLPVFATPKIKIKNSTNGAIKVDKVLIRAHEGGDRNSYQALPTTVMLNPKSGGFNGMEFMNATTTADKIAALQKALVVKTNPADCVYEYVIECDDELVEKDAYLRLAAVIPGGEYGRLDIFLFVEDQDGEKEKSIVRLSETERPEWCEKNQGAAMQTNMIVGERQVYTATIYDQSLGNIGVEGFTVVNSADLEYVLNFKAKFGGKEKLKITTWGDDVVMTQAIYDLLKADNRKNLELYINGKITIPAGIPADAIDQLSSDNFFGHITTVINEGNQELAKKEYFFDIVNHGTITEAEDVDVTIYGNVAVESGKMEVTTINGAEVVVAEGAELATETIETNTFVQNAGTLKAESVKTIDFINSGVATVETINAQTIENSNSLIVNNVTGRMSNIGMVDAMGGTLNNVYNGGLSTATINIKGVTSINMLMNNETGIVNVNANTTIQSGENYGTMGVAEGIYLKATNVLKNHDDATINVNGELVEVIQNSGLINVIGKGHVVVNGKVNDEVNGIIDVTLATEHAAKDNKANTNYFRYTVGTETTATALETSLKARISAENWGDDKNAIILVWGANSATTFSGVLAANVERVIIENTLTINGDASFCELNNLDWTETTTKMEGVTITAATNKAIWVKGTLIVANEKTLTVSAGENNYELNGTVPSTNLMICVDGKLRAENHGVVAGNAKVEGSGIVENAGASFAWTMATTWAGQTWIGF